MIRFGLAQVQHSLHNFPLRAVQAEGKRERDTLTVSTLFKPLRMLLISFSISVMLREGGRKEERKNRGDREEEGVEERRERKEAEEKRRIGNK